VYVIETGLVEAIISKVKAWEKERGQDFLYDGVSSSDKIIYATFMN